MGDGDTLDLGAIEASPVVPTGESKYRRGQSPFANKFAGTALVDALSSATVGILFPEFRARVRFLLEFQVVWVAAGGLPVLRDPQRRKNPDSARRGTFHSVCALHSMVV